MPVKTIQKNKYIESVGRRKTSIARVRITENAKNSFEINKKDVKEYFPTEELQIIATEAITKTSLPAKFLVTVLVKGGGIHGQAEAVRHGLGRALATYDLELRKTLKKAGYLKRDPRAKERKKFGLKAARKSPQWSKR